MHNYGVYIQLVWNDCACLMEVYKVYMSSVCTCLCNICAYKRYTITVPHWFYIINNGPSCIILINFTFVHNPPFNHLVQCTNECKEQNLSVPSLQPPNLFGHDKLYPKEDAEEVVYSAAVKNQRGNEGGAEVLCLAAALDVETKKDVGEVHMAANRDQELFLPPFEPGVDGCIVYTNEQVVYITILIVSVLQGI